MSTLATRIAGAIAKNERSNKPHGSLQKMKLSRSMGNTQRTDNSRPPRSLGPEGRTLWRRLRAEYGIQDAGGLALLRTACECRDLEVDAMQQARQDGLSTVDRYGQRRPHPLLSAARDARAQMLAALRALNLDVEPLRPGVGRPGGR